MPTQTRDNRTTEAQDQVLEAIRAGQNASLAAFRGWADAVAKVLPRVPELFVVPSVDNVIGFSEKLWSEQRDFNMKLYETFGRVGSGTFDAARSTAQAVRENAAQETSRAAAAAK